MEVCELAEFWLVIEAVAPDRQGYLLCAYHIAGQYWSTVPEYRASWPNRETVVIKLAFHKVQWKSQRRNRTEFCLFWPCLMLWTLCRASFVALLPVEAEKAGDTLRGLLLNALAVKCGRNLKLGGISALLREDPSASAYQQPFRPPHPVRSVGQANGVKCSLFKDTWVSVREPA